jgi:hypothetical protein
VEELTSEAAKKLGLRKALFVSIATVLIMAPAFVSKTLLDRMTIDMSVVALMGLAMFLVGVFLLLKFVTD